MVFRRGIAYIWACAAALPLFTGQVMACGATETAMHSAPPVETGDDGSGADPQAKVAPSVAAYFAAHPDGQLEVLLVLDAPQPDLSFMVGKTPADPAAQPSQTEEQAEATADRVRRLLEASGITRYNWLRSADSFVVTLDQPTLEVMTGSADIAEIVENLRAR